MRFGGLDLIAISDGTSPPGRGTSAPVADGRTIGVGAHFPELRPGHLSPDGWQHEQASR
jgi:hypothetical protein